MVPSLMVIDVKQNSSNQVLSLLSRSDLGHKIREVQWLGRARLEHLAGASSLQFPDVKLTDV